MTPQEAIERLKAQMIVEQNRKPITDGGKIDRRKNVKSLNMAISAFEKQIPKKPIDIGPLSEPVKIGRGIFGKGTAILQKCPVCDSWVNSVRKVKFCEECGQALDWGDEK